MENITSKYLQVSNIELPSSCPECFKRSRIDLKDLEPNVEYYEIKDFFTKHKLLHSLPVKADDVLVAKGYSSSFTKLWNPYTAVANWYIDNQSTIYQLYQEQEIVDQFFPDNLSLWLVDTTHKWQVKSLTESLESRTWITWLYKPETFDQFLKNWNNHNK